jgi:cytochrome o ubiquinol oxidase subunit II
MLTVMGKRTKKNTKYFIAIFIVVAVVISLLVYYFSHHKIAVLQPSGSVALKERHLIYVGLLLSAVVVIPTYALAIFIAVHYRESNDKAKYSPDFDRSKLFESIWWGIPIVIIGILSVITWDSSHALDPYKPLASSNPPITVDVVSLDWKWLFIYPYLNVASINQLNIPVNVPVHFYLTSDTVMNSFWVPSLGSQIYAMPGMTTQLNLLAVKTGSFYGSSANISGVGFSGMNFYANSLNKSKFNKWLTVAKSSSHKLNLTTYNFLAKPSVNNPVSYYDLTNPNLFNSIVSKYLVPSPADGLNKV